MTILFLSLVLSQAQADDPRVLAATIDKLVPAIAGYDVGKQAPVVGDEVFLRRLMTDLVGEEPAAADVAAFVKDPDPAKRERKISELLSDERFGEVWAGRFSAAFFGDPAKVRWTGIATFPEQYEARKIAGFTTWLALKLNQDRPWTDIVFQMLEARGTLEVDPALAYLLSFHRGKGLPREFAEGVSRDFLGIRLGCARCHDHPYDAWRVQHYFGLAAFVVRQRAEVKEGDVQVRYAADDDFRMVGVGLEPAPNGKPPAPAFLYGQKPGEMDDRMYFLAKAMTAKTTPQLPATLANRVWGWLMGRGVVHPVDDFTMGNKALVPALLNAMTKDLVDHGYSLKRLVKSIALSAQYQMATPAEQPDGESFRHLAKRKTAAPAYRTATVKPALEFKVPADWIGVKDRSGSKGMYVIPDKADPARFAEVGLYQGKFSIDNSNSPLRQVQSPVAETQKLEGKTAITVVSNSGQYWCQRGSNGPVDYRVWVASFEIGKSGWYFLATGPADLLDPRRVEFLDLLQTLGPGR